jgi:hypothetical protein
MIEEQGLRCKIVFSETGTVARKKKTIITE